MTSWGGGGWWLELPDAVGGARSLLSLPARLGPRRQGGGGGPGPGRSAGAAAGGQRVRAALRYRRVSSGSRARREQRGCARSESGAPRGAASL